MFMFCGKMVMGETEESLQINPFVQCPHVHSKLLQQKEQDPHLCRANINRLTCTLGWTCFISGGLRPCLFKNVGSLFDDDVILCNRFLVGNLVLALPLGRGRWILEYENTLETLESAINSHLIIII